MHSRRRRLSIRIKRFEQFVDRVFGSAALVVSGRERAAPMTTRQIGRAVTEEALARGIDCEEAPLEIERVDDVGHELDSFAVALLGGGEREISLLELGAAKLEAF